MVLLINDEYHEISVDKKAVVYLVENIEELSSDDELSSNDAVDLLNADEITGTLVFEDCLIVFVGRCEVRRNLEYESVREYSKDFTVAYHDEDVNGTVASVLKDPLLTSIDETMVNAVSRLEFKTINLLGLIMDIEVGCDDNSDVCNVLFSEKSIPIVELLISTVECVTVDGDIDSELLLTLEPLVPGLLDLSKVFCDEDKGAVFPLLVAAPIIILDIDCIEDLKTEL